jgi:D-amino-acid dehydrogenase
MSDQSFRSVECLVLGAGMVGVACALELQRLGASVRLLDRSLPGSETSYGNGGVIARSSLIPLNNPQLPSSLFKLLRNNTPQLRYSPRFVLHNLPWAMKFVRNTAPAVFDRTTDALDDLIRLSSSEHRRLVAEAGISQRLRDTGWLFLYRSAKAFEASAFSRSVYAKYSVATTCLDADGVQSLEPSLAKVFPKGLLIQDAMSVDSPGETVTAYARLFVQRGGVIEQSQVSGMSRGADGAWTVNTTTGVSFGAKHVVVALGPWAKDFLATLGLKIPMAFERGYHKHFELQAGATLSRPIYDTAKGYILTPMAQGLRLTTGVELTFQNAAANLTQLTEAEASAREVFPLASATADPIWLGARPTLPDSRPMIGRLPGYDNLWAAFGHQHIGFSTSTGTAALLGALIREVPPPFDPQPFSPARFNLQ